MNDIVPELLRVSQPNSVFHQLRSLGEGEAGAEEPSFGAYL